MAKVKNKNNTKYFILFLNNNSCYSYLFAITSSDAAISSKLDISSV